MYFFLLSCGLCFPFKTNKITKTKYSNIFRASSEYSNIFKCLKCNKSEYEYIFEAQNIRILEYSNIHAHPCCY